MCIYCETRKLQLVGYSYPQLRKRWLWNNQRLFRMISSLDVQLYLEERLGLDLQQDSLDRYSYGEANSLESCVDQGDHWVIKFRLGLNLFDLIKL